MNNGLTAESLLFTLPEVLRQDERMQALAQGIAEVLSVRPAEIERLLIYPRIDQMPEELLDRLAYDFKVDWWDADYTLGQKRQTFKDNWQVHRQLGTKAAIERAISAIYPATKVLEWFEYGGEPYHFKLNIDLTGNCFDKERQQRVLNRVEYYKNLRSHLDGVYYFTWAEPIIFQTLEQFQPISLKMPLRIVNNTREIIRLNGERRLDGSWQLDQDIRSLIFQQLLLKLALQEQERLSVAGAMKLQSRVQTRERLVWPQLEFGLRIGNLAFTRLNGERRLDGSWFLEQLAGGTKLSSLEIQSGWQLENRALAAGSLHLPGIKLTNGNKVLEPRLHLNSWLANSNAAKQPELKLQSGWQEQNCIAVGTLTRDTMWRLGGEAYLNGGKKLNAAIISENL